MPNLIKTITLYFFVCGSPRIFAMAWPAIVAGLERLLTRKTPPSQREDRAESKAPTARKRRRKNKRRKKR
ncbi:MAG: hypothetical protein LBC63_08265 [Holophagales bacterium]|jgi:hypothetical protein|nr:hypothetical protein [Holophagales bacterium]